MSRLATSACAAYRGVVRDLDEFVRYFRVLTPEQELGRLNVGSRPARRRKGTGVASLRAIPWVFAWTQVRLLLPAWLGVGEALREEIDAGGLEALQEMNERWPFFESTLDLIEMVLAKAAPGITERYERALVPADLAPLGAALRDRLKDTVRAMLEVSGAERLIEKNRVLRRAIAVRNPYVDPINLVQVELLERVRAERADDAPDDPELEHGLMITINGIAAGMRNTG
ncbi:MAG: phosphoenolpyruvate carboxylase [Planctomycetota bacterium]|jgi:phosphoenolpyruvate carboxylase